MTDAHVALGHLGADTLLDGAFPIDVGAAVRAIERLGRRLGMSAAATARGILAVADATMARAILVITAERAVDPATVPLVAFGGAGGLHAASLCQALGMPMAVLPPHPGAFSALGLALAGDAIECVEALHEVVMGSDLRRLLDRGAALLAQAQQRFAGSAAAAAGPARSRVVASVRYRGQGASLHIGLTRRMRTEFAAEHQRRFGFVTDSPLEVVQLVARVESTPLAMPRAATARTATARTDARAAPSVKRKGPLAKVPLVVLDREQLPVGTRFPGPLVCEEPTATTLVPAGFTLTVTPFGNTIAKTS